MAGLLIRDVRVADRVVDVRLRGGRIAAVAPVLPLGSDDVVDGGEGALIPGLHDHHIHLLAAAAAAASVDTGPPAVCSRAHLAAALATAALVAGWVRAVNYDASVAGDLDRDGLDALRSDVPVRLQHRSGALWVLNSAALQRVGAATADEIGIERDATGRPTGRLWRADDWLRERVAAPAPDIAALGARLARLGVTSVTDATPSMNAEAIGHLRGLPQRVTVLAADVATAPAPIRVGPAKIVLADHALPGWDELTERVGRARDAGRAVAVHSVTRESLLLALAVLAEVGAVPGDRIEHAAVAPPEAVEQLVALGVVVVTQPSLVARRGADYLRRVDADDLPFLWSYRSLLAAGIDVGLSSDAPYGDLDPWAGIRAAVDRVATDGSVVGTGERVDAATALRGYLGPAEAPGGPPRRVAVGGSADLVLLDAPLSDVLDAPSADRVRATIIGGEVVHG